MSYETKYRRAAAHISEAFSDVRQHLDRKRRVPKKKKKDQTDVKLGEIGRYGDVADTDGNETACKTGLSTLRMSALSYIHSKRSLVVS